MSTNQASTRLAIRPRFQAVPIGGDRVLLAGEVDNIVLTGSLYCALAMLLDGTRDALEILECLAPEFEAAAVAAGLQQLADDGLVDIAPRTADRAQAAFWDGVGLQADAAMERIRSTRVGVVNLCGSEQAATSIAEALTIFGIAADALGDIDLVIVEDYLDPRLAEINRKAMDGRRKWMLCKPRGRLCWIGPVFQPGESACWECLAVRLRDNVRVPAGADLRPIAGTPGTLKTASHLTALGLSKYCAGDSLAAASLKTFDFVTSQMETHPVTRRSICPACGVPRQEAGAMTHAPKLARHPLVVLEEGYRICRPHETVQRLKSAVSPLTGIISALHDAPGVDQTLSPVVRGAQTVPVRQGENRLSGRPIGAIGKGLTREQAVASCLAEGAERYSATFRGTERRVMATAAALDGPSWLPNELLLFSEEQFAHRDERAQPWGPAHWIPQRFDAARPIEWVSAWSMTKARPEYVPAAYCYFKYPQAPELSFCRADSNGCASGNSLEEAILQAVFELVERDAVALWWYNRARRPELLLDGLANQQIGSIIRALKRNERSLHVLDITTDLGIPACVAVSWDSSGRNILFGMGAHLEARIAITRAITELVQVIDLPARPETQTPEAAHWFREASIEACEFVVPSGASAPFPGNHPHVYDDILGPVEHCIKVCDAAGLNMLVLDLTRADVQFPTVRVIIPGLRHFWARLGPGRLYETPVALGWQDRVLTENTLNPIPFFL